MKSHMTTCRELKHLSASYLSAARIEEISWLGKYDSPDWTDRDAGIELRALATAPSLGKTSIN